MTLKKYVRSIVHWFHHPSSWWELAAIACCLLFVIAGSIVSVHRFWQYEVFYYDFGIYDQAIRHLAKFEPPVIDHYTVGGKIIWADHLHPGIMLLAPLYWITSRSEGLLILQSLAIGLSGYIIFRTNFRLLKSYLPSLAVLVMYLLFVGIQNAVITDFHEVAILTIPLAFAYWAILNNHKRWFVAFFVLCLSFKETLFLLGVGLSFFVWLYRPAWRKLAVGLAVGSISYGLFAIKFFIPYLSGGIYQYYENYDYSKIIQSLFWPVLKLKTVLNLFWSFGFLPLAYLPTLPIIILNLVPRFLSGAPSRWDLGMHYNAEIAPTLAISAALVLFRLQKRLSNRSMVMLSLLLIANSIFLHTYWLRGPLALAYNPAFYRHSREFGFLDKLIAQVPNGATVMTQNNLAVRFTDRPVYLLRYNYVDYQPEYILMDIRAGQNANNFYGLQDPSKLLGIIQADKQYRQIYATNEQFAFKRVE